MNSELKKSVKNEEDTNEKSTINDGDLPNVNQPTTSLSYPSVKNASSLPNNSSPNNYLLPNYGSNYNSLSRNCSYGPSYANYASNYRGNYTPNYGFYGNTYDSDYGGYNYSGGYGQNNNNNYYYQYYNNSQYNSSNNYPQPQRIGWAPADQSLELVENYFSFTDRIGRFASLLQSNSQALHSTIYGTVRFLENFTFLGRELTGLFTGFAVFKFLASYFPIIKNSFSPSRKTKRSHRKIIIFISCFTSLFFLLPHIYNIFRKVTGIGPNILEDDVDTIEETLAVAIHSYRAQNWAEISFNKGDTIVILEKRYPKWWKGEIKGNPTASGLFPINHVKLIDSKETLSSK